MKKALLLVLALAVLLTGCASVKKPDVKGFREYLRMKSIVASGTGNTEISFDEPSGTVSESIRAVSDYEIENPASAAEYEYESITKSAAEHNIGEIAVKISVVDSDGNVLYSETNGKDDKIAREENFIKTLRKMTGAFEVSPDDPMAGTWAKDESSGFSVSFPDEFTYGDVGWIFVTDGKFTCDDGKTLHTYHFSPDGSRLLVDNGFNENVIYKRQ